MFEHTVCPLCKHTSFVPFLNCKDYTVSQETFTIVSCSSCEFKFTNPVPDPSKIGDYYKSESYISHSDTKKGIVARLYHLVRNFTLKRKLKILDSNVSRGTLLDFGCGTGMFLKTCQNAGWESYGVEPDNGAAKIAGMNGGKVFSDMEQLIRSQPDIKFDAITLWHVLEHVPDLENTLSSFKRLLKPGGILVIAVPNYTSYDAKFYKQFWAAYDVPRHLYHFSPATIKLLLGKMGFVLSEMLPMKFDSYYVSMLSEQYKSGSVKYIGAFWRGFSSNFKAKGASQYSSVIYIFKHQ